MKTLAKILLLVTILISSYSCSSNQDDPTPTIVVPTPTIVVPTPTIVVPKITMGIKFNSLGDSVRITVTLNEEIDKLTKIIVSSKLKSTTDETIIINSKTKEGVGELHPITLKAVDEEYYVSSINDIPINDGTNIKLVQCDDLKMFEYIGAKITNILIKDKILINDKIINHNSITTTNGVFDLVVDIDPSKITTYKDNIISKIVGNGNSSYGNYDSYTISFVGIGNYIKYFSKDNK